MRSDYGELQEYADKLADGIAEALTLPDDCRCEYREDDLTFNLHGNFASIDGSIYPVEILWLRLGFHDDERSKVQEHADEIARAVLDQLSEKPRVLSFRRLSESPPGLGMQQMVHVHQGEGPVHSFRLTRSIRIDNRIMLIDVDLVFAVLHEHEMAKFERPKL